MKTLKRFFFKTCPKSGRIVALNRKNIWLKVIFPITVLVAVLWFLIRVVPKPSRISYPCQQVVAPIAIGGLVYLAHMLGVVYLYNKCRELFRLQRYMLGTCCGVALIVAVSLFVWRNSTDLYASILDRPTKEWIPTDGPNEPIGEGKGIFPGRVVWARDSTVSRWRGEFGEGKWWNDKFTNQDVVCRMMRDDLLALTGAADAAQAWDKIFAYHNRTFNNSERGYRKGEKIVIKINCNNAYDGYGDKDNQIDASKQTVLALLRELVHNGGVDQSDITLLEGIRVIPDRIYLPCHEEFADVLWMDSKGTGENGRQPVVWRNNVITYSQPTECGSGIPEAVYRAQYLINLFLVKGHISVGVSLSAKNHYGTINGRDHKWKLTGAYHPFVDFMGSKELGGKTVLYIADGLYGLRDVNDPVSKEFAQWNKTLHGGWLSSIFMSLDPVAIDAVCYDFLRSEFGARLGRGSGAPADTYMHEAALANKPPSGVEYRPNGVPLQSLGVHEHWNNPVERKYTKNINPQSSVGIELVQLYK